VGAELTPEGTETMAAHNSAKKLFHGSDEFTRLRNTSE
jgi:hypothetical protein